ncbi:Imm26 family immunity protein [uncultured Aquimarina sp.]|uniref:Imm26 family immunity protein n=1 Tax=uncultured Aquimarina sp. TaxID=575652 RepID=UPI002633D4E8|nr:Imm26 family immunity protein [uncultured Aquimarina sp.]
MNKLANVSSGEIYAIPLFLSAEKDTKSFSRDKFQNKGKEFAFCRIIEDLKGGGILVEVFDYIGTLDESLSDIIKSNRLFPPISTSGLGIGKKRWKKIHLQDNYDQEKDSEYSEITLVAGTYDDLSLWKGGKTIGSISEVESEKHEKWIVWRASNLEKRIIKELFGETVS